MIRVTAIEPVGYQRIVHLENTDSGATYSMTFGDSVSERWIRQIAPMLVKTKTKTKKGK